MLDNIAQAVLDRKHHWEQIDAADRAATGSDN